MNRLALLCLCLWLLNLTFVTAAFAQDAEPKAEPGEPTPATPVEPQGSVSVPNEPDDNAVLKAQVESLQKAMDEMRARELAREQEAQAAKLLEEINAPEVSVIEDEPLRFYGFMDMGVSHLFIPDRSLLAKGRYTKATSFFLGNINLYLDANPLPDWRGLFEVRFTNYPHGNESSVTVQGTDQVFKRESTQVPDHTNPAGSLVILGSTVIERAWIQWQRYDAFRLQVGYWLTPFGIWNVDHGQPTLISLLLPQFIARRGIVPQQLGVQALGKLFVRDWSIDYALYVSNGRTPGQLDLTEDKAFGGRFVARTGRAQLLALGASVFWGRYADTERTLTEIDVNDFDPLTIRDSTREAFDELSLGADASYDYEGFRLRIELFARRIAYDEGKRGAVFNLEGLPPQEASGWGRDGYVLAAYELPFWGLEPFGYFEMLDGDSGPYSDYVFLPSAGFNIHFNDRALLKTQYLHVFFRDHSTKGRDEQRNDGGYAAARLVLSF